jgi:peroxiredoxin
MNLRTEVPTASLPGVVDGDTATVDLASRVGDELVLLVFYPSNAGPNFRHSAAVLRACSTVVDQSDTEVLPFGIATESVYSLQRFADEAGIPIPLLSDTEGDLARAYDVATTRQSGQTVARLSTFLIGYEKLCLYEWRASEPGNDPPMDDLRSAIVNTSRTQSARGTYRLGYTLYREGRRLLSSGLSQCEQANWALARTDFVDGGEKFATATDKFIQTQGLADGDLERTAEEARVRATKLWEATEWLAGYAAAAEDDRSETTREYQEKAEHCLLEARDRDPLPSPSSASKRVVE